MGASECLYFAAQLGTLVSGGKPLPPEARAIARRGLDRPHESTEKRLKGMIAVAGISKPELRRVDLTDPGWVNQAQEDLERGRVTFIGIVKEPYNHAEVFLPLSPHPEVVITGTSGNPDRLSSHIVSELAEKAKKGEAAALSFPARLAGRRRG